MQGFCYQTREMWNDFPPVGFDAANYYCVETGGGKVHVIQSLFSWDGESVQLVGPCDGSCMHMAELSPAVEDVVMGRVREKVVQGEQLVPQHWFLDEFHEEIIEEPIVEKLIGKVNRWAKRYRWHPSRRFVADFS